MLVDLAQQMILRKVDNADKLKGRLNWGTATQPYSLAKMQSTAYV